MSNFAVQAYLSFKGLFAWIHWWSWLSSVWIRPLTTTALFAAIGRFAIGDEAAERYLLGIAVLQMVHVVAQGVLRGFSEDLNGGTLSHVLSTPVNRFAFYWTRGFPHAINGLIAFWVCILSVWLVLGLDLSRVNWPALVLTMPVVTLTTTALVLVTSAWVLATREYVNLIQLVVGSLLLLTGAVIPLTEFPAAVRALSQVLPVTNGLAAARDGFAGSTLSDIAPALLAELAIGVLLTTSGFLIFRYVEARGRETGFIEGLRP
jgi:ABC-type polysaccharide/polyol phosphate export permease